MCSVKQTGNIKYIVVAYDNDDPVRCGSIKAIDANTMEVKRIFVVLNRRGQGIVSEILAKLETCCQKLSYQKCKLETGKNQPEAIALYKKNAYKIIPNYGHYQHVENSIFFEKELMPAI